MRRKPISRFFPPFTCLHAGRNAAVLAFLLLAACHPEKEPGKDKQGGPQKLRAEAVVLQPEALESVCQSSGNLLANESVNVYPEVAGRVTAIHFREGAVVHKGDLLISLYDNDIKAQIEKLKVQRKLQVLTRERQDELLSISGISRQEYDNTVAQIASIDADIAYNEALQRRLQVRASFDGVIGLRNISVGAVVSPATLLTTIQQVHPLKLDFPVPEQYKGMIKAGDAVYFTVTGNPDTLSARVMAIEPAADATTRTIMMRALASNQDRKLAPGAFANVFATLKRNTAAITVPSQSIIPTTRDKKVAVLRAGKAELVSITTGARRVSDVEVLQGLKAGDTVLTTGIMQVKPGMEVSITKIIR